MAASYRREKRCSDILVCGNLIERRSGSLHSSCVSTLNGCYKRVQYVSGKVSIVILEYIQSEPKIIGMPTSNSY